MDMFTDDVIRYMLLLHKLSPLDLISLRQTCKKFKQLIDGCRDKLTKALKMEYDMLNTVDGIIMYLSSTLKEKDYTQSSRVFFLASFPYIGILEMLSGPWSSLFFSFETHIQGNIKSCNTHLMMEKRLISEENARQDIANFLYEGAVFGTEFVQKEPEECSGITIVQKNIIGLGMVWVEIESKSICARNAKMINASFCVADRIKRSQM